MDHNLVLFKERNYLLAKYDLVKKVHTIQVFFLTLLKVQEEYINHNHSTDLSDLQIYLASFRIDRVNCYKSS